MLNLLYITHGSNDFADDMHFIGLTRFLKSFNIYFSMASSEFGKPATIYDRHIEHSWKSEWIKSAEMLKPVDHSIQYDICIVGQVWDQNQDEFLSLKHLLKPDAKIILVDSTDDGGPQIPIKINNYYYFKNNISASFYESYTPFACPYGILDKVNNGPIKYEINCQLGNTHSSRHSTTQSILDISKELGIEDKSLISLFSGHSTIIGSSPRTPIHEYWPTIEQTRIIVHERGCGMDAFRFWEAMATGNFVLCSPRNLFKQNNVPMPENVIFWENEKDLKEIIEYAINVPEENIMKMRSVAKAQAEKYHAPHRRLEKMFRLLEIPYSF
jgi:hypothetical protein